MERLAKPTAEGNGRDPEKPPDGVKSSGEIKPSSRRREREQYSERSTTGDKHQEVPKRVYVTAFAFFLERQRQSKQLKPWVAPFPHRENGYGDFRDGPANDEDGFVAGVSFHQPPPRA